MEKNLIVLEVYGKELSTKEGRKFIKYSTKLQGVYFDLRITQVSNIKLNNKGAFKLVVDLNMVSIQNDKTYIDKEGKEKPCTPILWVRNIEEIKEYTEEEKYQMNLKSTLAKLQNLKETQGANVAKAEEVKDSDLPF